MLSDDVSVARAPLTCHSPVPPSLTILGPWSLPSGYRPTGGHLNTQSPHTQYIHTLCSLRSPRALARSRSLALRSSPRLCSARFARCTLATSPAARFVCLACRLASLAASPAALASLVLRLLPRACPLLCACHAFCSLRSPGCLDPCLLLAALDLPAARSSPLRLLRSPPRQLLSLRSPPRLRLLASLTASPAAARVARRLTYSPVFALSATDSVQSVLLQEKLDPG
jgi:hypothetical protein